MHVAEVLVFVGWFGWPLVLPGVKNGLRSGGEVNQGRLSKSVSRRPAVVRSGQPGRGQGGSEWDCSKANRRALRKGGKSVEKRRRAGRGMKSQQSWSGRLDKAR